MKKLVSVYLCLILLFLTIFSNVIAEESDNKQDYSSFGDSILLQQIEDEVYAEIENTLKSDDYEINSVHAIYISQEYLDELAFNSQMNVFFGFTIDEIEAQFQGKKYVFTLGADCQTTIKPLEVLEEHTFEQVIQNVAIGSGVVLLCVTVSVVATSVGAPATISVVFATAARTAMTYATKGFVLGGLSAGIVKGIETGNFEEAVKTGFAVGSEGFKWGAISGAVVGGFSEALSLRGAIRTPRDSEIQALKKYGGADGREQVAYLNGVEVKYSTYGATRPDVVHTVENHIEAIEVKNYKLDNQNSFNALKNELYRQVSSRIQNLPEGSSQRIVLDVQGRGYSLNFINEKIAELKEYLDIYPDIPIDYMLN